MCAVWLMHCIQFVWDILVCVCGEASYLCLVWGPQHYARVPRLISASTIRGYDLQVQVGLQVQINYCQLQCITCTLSGRRMELICASCCAHVRWHTTAFQTHKCTQFTLISSLLTNSIAPNK